MSRTAALSEPALAMSRAEFRAWVEQQPRGRFERINGVVVAMAPERIAHARAKSRIWQALDRAIRATGVPCEALPDGLTVEVGDYDFEPDAVVRCGARLAGDSIAVLDPLIIVEVLSRSTGGIDRGVKLAEYFKLPSLHHYLIVWPDKPQIVHHRRGVDGSVESATVTAGDILLEPPGITITVEDVYVD